ncbi:MAG: flavodoxin [Butyrivibrio sp.]|nr:flavodoxin [Acetatifactor muris]MCM1560884.1 flavodoxin [Butyrivibrio sp.]
MKKGKKSVSVLCILSVLLFCLAGCSSVNSNGEKGSDSLAPQETGQSEQQENSGTKTEESFAAVNSAEQSSVENQTESQNTEPAAGIDEQTAESGKVLVAYFSATGTTKTLAEYAADALGADLYEIVPEEPYSSADLDYGNSSSRSSVEMNDPSARPGISGSVEDMAQYDIIFLGYPIWWGEAPRIVDTFMESYDFSGKTIVPFCTSASSGIGSSARNLHGLCAEDVTWLGGSRLKSSTSREDMVEWINGLGLDVEAE